MYLWRFNTSFYYFPVDLFTPRNNKRMWKNKLCEISLSLFSVNVTYILPHWREIHYFLSSIIFIRKWFYLWLKQWEKSHYCTFQEHADSKIKRPTDKFVFRCRRSNVWRLLPAYDYRQALFRCLNSVQRFDVCAPGNNRRLGRSRRTVWLTVVKNAFVVWALNFRVRMLLKGAVRTPWRLYFSVICTQV